MPVPEGPFLRGSPPEVGLPEEQPQREIWLDAFEIDRFPVTFGQFAAFIQAGGYADRAHWSEDGWAFKEAQQLTRPRFWTEPEWAHVTGLDQPVVGVSWYEAEAYARFARKRLLTEAEWEKAARGDDGRLYPWGNAWEPDRCSFRGGPTRAAPPVGRFPGGASPYGVEEMCGGVWEFCADWFSEGYYARAPARNPPGPERGTMKVARGGAWNALPLLNRTANRNAWKPTARFSNIGFRCARSISVRE
ncbi:MAG TPA: SUMF1/EgtB/PvdO family nonheme iron enzyme [Myxococcales bacterium]|nr:SUMF1/EgtB/PvdO family nonheme iron enzyme [Myxococcales bacterium]